MAKLTDDELSLLEKLTAKAKEPDKDDHEIEIYDTKSGKGARLPFSQGAKWLFETFGIGDAPQQEPPATKGSEGGTAAAGSAEGSVSYFGGKGRRTG
jgi:hypothetical protein